MSEPPAGPYGHVLVGTDGSATAQDAVRHAAAIARACGARLTIVSAYVRRDSSSGLAAVPDDATLLTDAAGAQDNVVAGQALAREVGVASLGGRTESGDPAAVLLDVADDVSADVIVVGSRGMASAARFVLGSVPNRVSHHAKCDVIIVRTGD